MRGGFASLLFLVAQTFARVSTLLERARTAARVRKRLQFMGQCVGLVFLFVGIARENLVVGLRVGFAAVDQRPITMLVKAIFTSLGALPFLLVPRLLQRLIFGVRRKLSNTSSKISPRTSGIPDDSVVDTSSLVTLASSFCILTWRALRESRSLAFTSITAVFLYVAGTFRAQSVLSELRQASSALRTYLRLWVLVVSAVRSARHRQAQSFTNLGFRNEDLGSSQHRVCLEVSTFLEKTTRKGKVTNGDLKISHNIRQTCKHSR